MRRRNLIRAAMAIACTFAFAVGSHAAAPVARAECDGGSTYGSAVGHARGAIVGVIAETQQDDLGFVYASGVIVERAVGMQVGPVFHGRSDAGLCSEDFATVGARVVVLLDVTIPGVPGGPWNPFYIVGRTVTAAQVASLAGDLPDTGTAQVTKSPAGPVFPGPVAIAAGLVLLVGLLMRYQPRRSGVSPLPPRLIRATVFAGHARTSPRQTSLLSTWEVPLKPGEPAGITEAARALVEEAADA